MIKKLLNIIVMCSVLTTAQSIIGKFQVPWKEIFVRSTLMCIPICIRFQDALAKDYLYCRCDTYELSLNKKTGDTAYYNGIMWRKKSDRSKIMEELFMPLLEIQRGVGEGIILNILYSALKNR